MVEAYTNKFDYDFIGFTYNKVHSIRDLGIYRVSDGSRYENQLAPTLTENTMEIPGNDGMYFFGSYHKQKTFTINVAFDAMTETQLRTLRKLFNGKEVGELIFDETPYKAYSAKITGTPSLKFICFDEKIGDKVQRVYKGEGTLQFVCYSPYAYTPDWCWEKDDYGIFSKKSIDGRYFSDYPDDVYQQKEQWESQSLWDYSKFVKEFESGEIIKGIENSAYICLSNDSTQEKQYWLANKGDLPSSFEMMLTKKLPSGEKIGFETTNLNSNEVFKYEIELKENIDEALQWNSKTGMVAQLKNGEWIPVDFSGDSCAKLLDLTIFRPEIWPAFNPKDDDIKFKFWYY